LQTDSAVAILERMELLKRILATEPVRLGEALTALVTIIAMFTSLLDPAQAAVIIASLVTILEVIRSIVYAPATVAGLLRERGEAGNDA
jgi:hypothetical protein